MKRTPLLSLTFLVATFWLVYGVPKSETKSIHKIGIRPAHQGEAPYQVSLQSEEGVHLCGATLTDVDGIQIGVTAASCFIMNNRWNRTVYLVAGDLDLMDSSGIEQRRELRKAVIHPGFYINNIANDIAILFFDTPFVVNENVAAVRLPTSNTTKQDTELIVTGWMAVWTGGGPAIPPHLRLAVLTVIQLYECQDSYYDNIVVDSMICAAIPAGDRGPCFPDNGGPAVNDKGTLLGVASFGFGCSSPKYPFVFTDVAYFLQWIHERINMYRNGEDD